MCSPAMKAKIAEQSRKLYYHCVQLNINAATTNILQIYLELFSMNQKMPIIRYTDISIAYFLTSVLHLNPHILNYFKWEIIHSISNNFD